MEIRKEAGIFAAAVGISAVVTAGFGWLEVTLGWIFSAVLRLVLPVQQKNTRRKAAACISLLGGIIITAATMLAAEQAFPEDSTFPFVSLGLLFLLWRVMIGEPDTGKILGNVLALILLPLMAAIMLFGLADVTWTENIPSGVNWRQILITVGVSSPWWCMSTGKGSWWWFIGSAALSIGMSLLTRGILGTALTAYTKAPLYRAVQTIHILGSLQRFEALLAAAVLLGSFAMLTLAGRLIGDAVEILAPKRKKSWRSGIACLAAFVLEWGYRFLFSSVKNSVSAIFWGMIPLFALWVVFHRKKEKSS